MNGIAADTSVIVIRSMVAEKGGEMIMKEVRSCYAGHLAVLLVLPEVEKRKYIEARNQHFAQVSFHP